MPKWRTLLSAVMASLCVALATAPLARAQEAPAEAPPETSPAVEQPNAQPSATPKAAKPTNGDRTMSAFSEALEQWTEQIEAQEQAIADEATSDEELRAIPELLEALRESIVEQRAQLKPKLQDARERLAKLGPPPEDGAPKESAEIAAQRERLEKEVASLDGKLKQADILFVRAGQVIDEANEERRERFTESLFRPVPNFYSDALPAGLEGLQVRSQQVRQALADWFVRAWEIGKVFFFLLIPAPILAAVMMARFIGKLTGRRDTEADAESTEELTLQERGAAAFKKSLWRSLPIWAGLAVFYLISVSAGLADPGLEGFLLKALISVAWGTFLYSLVRQSLVPEDPTFTIIPATEPMSWRIAGLLWTLITFWLFDQVSILIDSVVFMPYQVSVLRSAIFASLYGILIAAIVYSIQSGTLTRQAITGWRAWLLSFTAIIAAVILLAVLLGYESLARFIGTNAVSTAGVLWIMYLLHLTAEDISSVSVISGAPIDDDLEEEEDMGAPSLLTIRIIVSLLIDIAILAIGIVILLLLWRFDWVEVRGWIQAAFFGFQFGNLRISLQSVLIALGVFALGLLLTRFVQRWFTGRVFSGRRSESGLHESVRIGIGYLGFVLAALAGISYLGVDFSNLALIAGALSVGIGFGLQSIFNNFVSGLILLIERPIKIGDYIHVSGQEGTVKKISVRSTEIETIYRQSVIIPNATLITDPVTNWMHLDKVCRLDIAVGVDYGTDVERLRSALLEVAHAHRGVLKSPPAVVHFAGFGDSSLDFELRVFLRDVRERIKSASELRFAILDALREASITIPFPQRDIHIKDGGLAPAESVQAEEPRTSGQASKAKRSTS